MNSHINTCDLASRDRIKHNQDNQIFILNLNLYIFFMKEFEFILFLMREFEFIFKFELKFIIIILYKIELLL